MAHKKAKNKNTLIIVALLALAVVLGGFYYANMQREKSLGPTYPDKSALGVTYNFYQWYTSCLSEAADDSSPGDPTVTCYQKTTYLTPTLVKELDKKQTSVLCNKSLDFHSVGVNVKTQTDLGTVVDVTNSKTKQFVSEVTTKQISGNWQILNISCSQSN